MQGPWRSCVIFKSGYCPIGKQIASLRGHSLELDSHSPHNWSLACVAELINIFFSESSLILSGKHSCKWLFLRFASLKSSREAIGIYLHILSHQRYCMGLVGIRDWGAFIRTSEVTSSLVGPQVIFAELRHMCLGNRYLLINCFNGIQ